MSSRRRCGLNTHYDHLQNSLDEDLLEDRRLGLLHLQEHGVLTVRPSSLAIDARVSALPTPTTLPRSRSLELLPGAPVGRLTSRGTAAHQRGALRT